MPSFVLGRQQSVARLLAWTVTILVLVDPMLVWSVGFWLSTGATAGVCLVAPPLAERLPGPRWLRVPLAVTLGAQVGVVLPSWLVFHRLPLVSLPANLLAVPVAGFVMLFAIPAGLLSALLPPFAPVLLAPCAAGTRWVATAAYLGLRSNRRRESPRQVGWLLWPASRPVIRHAGGTRPAMYCSDPAWLSTSSPATTSRCCLAPSPTSHRLVGEVTAR